MCKIKDSIIDKPVNDSEYIAPLNELQNKILKCFYDLQCNEDEGYYMDDETPTMGYPRLEDELKLERSRIKPDLLDLRNRGLVYLGNCYDYDYVIAGTGYYLTDKGAELVKQMFFKEKSICCDAEIVDGRCFNCKENVN